MVAYKADSDKQTYLGFWIRGHAQEDSRNFWCRTVVEEDEGLRKFSLTETIEWDGQHHGEWPKDADSLGALLMRQGLGIARALVALDAVPDGQFVEVSLPPEGPPYKRPDDDHLARLILRGLRNLRSKYRRLDEYRLDVRGIGELLWSNPSDTDYVFERLRNRDWAEIMTMGWDDNFGALRATEYGLLALEEDEPALPRDLRGFKFDEGQGMPSPGFGASSESTGDDGSDGRGVFVVHGRDDAMKETVARWIGGIGLQPIILHEQPSAGRTIIEKFDEESAGARYAVVLASPDDEGRLIGQQDDLHPRPRQNVVLELGFFLGRLGRENVSVLKRPDVEMPSDYDGVVFIDFDNRGAWKMELGKELKAAGMPLDDSKFLDA